MVHVRSEGLGDGLEEEGRLVDDSDLGGRLLDGEAEDGEHGEATVLDLLELHLLAVLGGEGVQAEGVETEVSGGVAVGVLPGHAVEVDRGGEADEGE